MDRVANCLVWNTGSSILVISTKHELSNSGHVNFKKHSQMVDCDVQHYVNNNQSTRGGVDSTRGVIDGFASVTDITFGSELQATSNTIEKASVYVKQIRFDIERILTHVVE